MCRLVQKWFEYTKGDSHMHEYSDCYIALLDIIGFKAMLGEKTCEEIYSIFSEEWRRNPLATISSSSGAFFSANSIKMKVMSDSLFLYVDSRTEYALPGLIYSCMQFQENLLCRMDYILSRGAIVRGSIFVENDFLFGKGFVDAHILGDVENRDPRIILSDEIVEQLNRQMTDELRNLIQGCIIVDDDGKYALDVCGRLEGFDTNREKCKLLLNQIEENLNACESIRKKHTYLKKHLLRWYKPERQAETSCNEESTII